jgi:hypothetical protein
MKTHVRFGMVIGLCAVISQALADDATPSSKDQLRLLITLGEKQTITRPRDGQKADRGEIIVSCDTMTVDRDRYVFVNGTLELQTGYLTFAEIALTFTANAVSISAATPNKSLGDIHFRLKDGVDPKTGTLPLVPVVPAQTRIEIGSP